MAGIYLELCLKQHVAAIDKALKYVDAGECDIVRSFSSSSVKAVWTYWNDSTQWRETKRPGQLLVIEGTPDRYPAEDESIQNWLKNRWGSFRGFEVRTDMGATRVTAFVDPWASRPLFLDRSRSDGFAVADKLSTLVVNSPTAPSMNWGAVLEAMIVGHYSCDTTIEGVVQLRPGESVVLTEHGCVSTREQLQGDPSHSERVRRDPEETLLQSLRCAVSETWKDLDAWLLLSGGLDSRFTLALAEGRRKALTLGHNGHVEAQVAKQIASACGAEWRLQAFSTLR